MKAPWGVTCLEMLMSDSLEKKKGPAEVVALEDELVNRQLGDFAGVISEHTKDFWREQLLSNREGAVLGATHRPQVEGGFCRNAPQIEGHAPCRGALPSRRVKHPYRVLVCS